jgi:hypothetical protein
MRKVKKGQVGFVLNGDLGIPHSGGHYVYVRKVYGRRCEVNVVTSLENKDNGFIQDRIGKVKRGMIYPIPYGDAGFGRWSGITKNPKQVEISKISIQKIKIKKRHRFMVGKYFGFAKKKPPSKREPHHSP